MIFFGSAHANKVYQQSYHLINTCLILLGKYHFVLKLYCAFCDEYFFSVLCYIFQAVELNETVLKLSQEIGCKVSVSEYLTFNREGSPYLACNDKNAFFLVRKT